MTAISIGETKPSDTIQAGHENKESTQGCCRKSVSVAFLVVVCVTLTAICASVVVVIEITRNKAESPEWISWTRVTGNIEIHESALIDVREQTMMMVSAEAYKIDEDNSMALHDFNTGNVALRDFKAQACFVGKIDIPDFQRVQKMLEKRQDQNLPLQPMRKARSESRTMTSSEMGPILSKFCEGVPAHWYTMIPNAENKRDVLKPPPHVACYFKRLEFLS